MRRTSRTVSAPPGLGLDVIGVPEGASVHLDLRLEAVMEGVLVTGAVRAALSGECVRCLDRLDDDLVTEFSELYAYDDSETTDDAPRLVGDLVDLEATLRDAVLLALPVTPLCRSDCPGLCSQCGARIADDPGHAHEDADPRWAALATLLTDDERGTHRADKEQEN